MAQGLNKEKLKPCPKTGVWWDLDTCPPPKGYELGCVRPTIECALKENFARGQVTIFAIGNLQVISDQVLKDLSSNGILLRHSPYGGGAMLFDALCEWRELNPSPGKIMLISGSKSWCSHSLLRFGYRILRAFPSTRPVWTYGTSKQWESVWTTLLKGNSSPLLEETNSQILEETVESEPACFCRLCEISLQSCGDFIDHLKSTEHASKELITPESKFDFVGEENWFKYFRVGDSFPLNEFDEPLLICRLCKYSGYDLHNMIIHYYSEEHAQNLALAKPNATITPSEGFHKKFYAGPQTTRVWWDLNTCPIPDDYELRWVRPSIELVLKKHFGTGPVSVFAIGNLDFVSAQFLKDISSCGIRLIHTPSGSGSEVFDLLCEWENSNPSPGNVMLISGNKSWYRHSHLQFGYTILRVFPKYQPAEAYGSYKEWVWESLLKENSVPLVEKHSQMIEERCTETVEPACFCRLCGIPIQNCDDFIKHLKTRNHKLALLVWVRLDENDRPEHFCNVCKYPALDNINLTAHEMSEVHKQKVLNPGSLVC